MMDEEDYQQSSADVSEAVEGHLLLTKSRSMNNNAFKTKIQISNLVTTRFEKKWR